MPDAGEFSLDAVAQMMSKAPIFSALKPKELRSLARAAKVRSLPADLLVVKQGDDGIGFYLVLAGKVAVRKNNRTIAQLGPGQFFGEMTLLRKTPRSADVRTTVPSQVAVLSSWEFWGFAKTRPLLLKSILEEMARRLAENERPLSE